MKNSNLPLFNKILFLVILVNLIINIIFFLQTLQNPWISDDYQRVFGTKLFNLINDQKYFFFEFNVHGEGRFIPLFTFLTQFIPENYIIWHGIVVFIFFISSIILFLLTLKITNNLSLSFLSTIFFSLNYSISIKLLSWNIFFGHVFNGLLGLASIYFFLLYLEKKKFFYLFIYLINSFFGILISETGLIYPLITLAVIFLFRENLHYKSYIKTLIPVFIYVILVFFNTGKFLPLFFDRLNSIESHISSTEFKKNEKNSLYFYRSTYAPRDLKGYSLRIIDNIFSSLNISSIENSLQYYEKNIALKNFLKKNYFYAISIIILTLMILIYFTLKDSKKYFSNNLFKNLSLLYIFVLMIYSIIYFRRDLNFGLSIFSSIILAYTTYAMYHCRKFYLLSIMLIIFFSSTLIYSSTKFSYFGDFESRSKLHTNFNKYLVESNNKNLDKNIHNYHNYKYIFYYKNYEDFKGYLQKYKNLSLKEFDSQFYNNE